MHIEKTVVLLLLLGLLQGCVTSGSKKPTDDNAASNVNVELGIGYLRQGNLELASEKLLRALQYNPDNVKANYTYAILQDRLGQKELAERHYRIATRLDPKNPEAANNYGAFLCRNDRARESEKYFLRALDDPLYKTPEFAYTNAAICLLKVNEVDDAREYLRKALAAKSDFAPALLAMSELLFSEGDYAQTKLYIDRYHLAARASAQSLWLAIRNTLELDSAGDVTELAQRLESEFPDSREYQDWLKIQ